MGIKFKQEFEVEAREAVFLNGEKIGRIDTSPDEYYGSKYHAVFNLRSIRFLNTPTRLANLHCSGLVQGHGETKEEAISNAFAESKEAAETYLILLKTLKAEVDKSSEGIKEEDIPY